MNMKLRRFFTLCLVALLLTGAALAAAPAPAFASAPAAAMAAGMAQTDDVSGTYVSNVYPAASAPGLVMLMSLYPNNNAELVNFYFSNPPVTERGTWEMSDGKVTLTLTENDNGKYDTPSTETFEVQGDTLVSGTFAFQRLDQVTPEEMEAASAEAAASDTGGDVAASEPVTETETVTSDAGAAVATSEEMTATTEVTATEEMTGTEAVAGTEEMTGTESAGGAAYEVFVTDVYPAADASGMVTLMALYPNMNMEQLTVYLGETSVQEVGTWSDANAGFVDVTITGTPDKEYETPVTTSYAREGELLSDGVFTFHQLTVVTPADMEAMTNPAGTYVSKLYPAADASGLMLILSLFDNNNAEQVNYYVAKATITEQGTWKQNDDGTITVSITGSGGQTYATPSDTTYTRSGEILSDGTFELTRAEEVTPAELAASGGATSNGEATGSAAEGAAGGDELAGTSWVWTETLMSDDTKTTPAQADAFQMTFGTDGSVSTTTDCNTNAGSYTVDGNQIKLDFQISTMMACPNDAQEAEYIKDLLGVQSYLIADGNLVLEFPMDSGTMTFAPVQ